MADYGSGGWGFESLAARYLPRSQARSRIPVRILRPVQTDLVGSGPVWRMIRSADPWLRVQSPAILAMWQGRCFSNRDFFGAHTYQRVDRPGSFHTRWTEDGQEVEV
jgi:hypothetical protein